MINIEILNINPICNTRFGSTDREVKQLSVYPSVITNEVRIVSSEKTTLSATVTITTLEGKVAYNSVISLNPQAETSINTSDFIPGIYTMNISTELQNQVFRIVKK